MSLSYWRPICTERIVPIIQEHLERFGKKDLKGLKKKISEAYPFGMRKYHPYKTWLDEKNKQLFWYGFITAAEAKVKPSPDRKKKVHVDENQTSLF